MSRIRSYTRKEELINSLSHLLGIILGIIGGYILLSKAYANNNTWAIGSVYIYLIGMLSSYISSTWYHALSPGKEKRLLQKFDHAAIYCHIAGTYTPLTLVTLREEEYWGWMLFLFIWSAAIIGIIMSFRKLEKHSYIETACYVAMGCSVLIAFKPLIDVLNIEGKIDVLYWIIIGGVLYIVGAIFYSLAKIKYMHTIFHFFTLGGSLCHMIAIWLIIQ